jgi:hypothetical protein
MKRSLLLSGSAVSILLFTIELVLNGQTVIFNENFSGFTTGTHSSPTTSDVSGALDQRTQSPGWTGSKIYSAGGEIKIGTSEITGWIETPLIDFSGYEDTLALKFDISRWPGIPSIVQISVNGLLLGNSISPSDEFRTIEIPINPGIASGKIKFESLAKRFFLDNIMVNSRNITSIRILMDEMATVRIYPNPVRDIITFSNITHYRLLEISDINGIILKTIKSDGADNLEVSLVYLQPGIYFVRFISDKGSIVYKIIRCN